LQEKAGAIQPFFSVSTKGERENHVLLHNYPELQAELKNALMAPGFDHNVSGTEGES
jgi:hypothetical protein